jgi:hypothetical protein
MPMAGCWMTCRKLLTRSSSSSNSSAPPPQSGGFPMARSSSSRRPSQSPGVRIQHRGELVAVVHDQPRRPTSLSVDLFNFPSDLLEPVYIPLGAIPPGTVLTQTHGRHRHVASVILEQAEARDWPAIGTSVCKEWDRTTEVKAIPYTQAPESLATFC